MKKLVLFTLVVFFLFPFYSAVQAQDAGNVGSSECGELQSVVQETVGDEDPGVYRNHGKYVSTVAKIVSPLQEADEITEACSSCIVNQFARRVIVADQLTCGPVVPTQSCRDTNPPPEQIEAAVIEVIDLVSDPWGKVNDFEIFLHLTEVELGCLLRGDVDSEQAQASQQSSQGAAVPGVNYCGPGNSETNDLLDLVDVPQCLNTACYEHDTCYGEQCVDVPECIWAPQSQECDDSLIATCNGAGSCGLLDLLDPMALVVCTAAQCLNGTFPSSTCVALRDARLLLYPHCNEPPSLETCNLECAGQTCSTFTTCNPGSGCVDPVCGSLAEGGGICVEGRTPCFGLADCTTSADCGSGLCFVDSCCGRPVCAPPSAFCPDIGANQSSVTSSSAIESGEGPTIGCIK